VTVSLSDNGGTANGGDDTSDAQTFTVTVTPVNDAPSFTSGGHPTILEDAGPQSSAWATAVSPGPANEAAQTLTFNVSNGNNALFATQPAIAPNGTLSYTTAPDANGTAIVTVTLSDDGGTTNGGVDTTTPPQTFTITVTPVNDPPIATDDVASTPEDTPFIVDAAILTGNDSPGPLNEIEQALTLINVMDPEHGTVQLIGSEITFTPDAGYHGPARFRYTVQDDDEGPLSDVAEVSLTVLSVNDAPAGADNTVAGQQNGVITFTLADFGFADTNDTPADNFARVKITSAPAAGTLSVGDTPLAADSFVDAADIVAGNLKFAPAADATGVPYASFTFQVEDAGGTDNGGVSLDPSPNTMAMLVWKLTAMTDCAVSSESPEVSLFGNAVTLGTPRLDSQPLSTCIHGATALLPPLAPGMTKYEVTFSYNLFSWDSYNAVDPEVPGTGYFDSFSVSVSTTPYQELELTDPVTTTNLPGLGFLWGGTSHLGTLQCLPAGCGLGTYESVIPGSTIAVMPGTGGNNYLNVVLDTNSEPQRNDAHPSYGRIRILSVVQKP